MASPLPLKAGQPVQTREIVAQARDSMKERPMSPLAGKNVGQRIPANDNKLPAFNVPNRHQTAMVKQEIQQSKEYMKNRHHRRPIEQLKAEKLVQQQRSLSR